MPDLKPCPFCGHQPKVFKYKSPVSNVEKVFIFCVHMDCHMRVKTMGCDTEEEAIAMWNRRASNGD